MANSVSCEHLDRLLNVTMKDQWHGQDPLSCVDCGCEGPNLWICLQGNCLHVGCSENRNDHSTIHYQNNPQHCVHMNLVTERIWCYECKKEVFFPPIFNMPYDTTSITQSASMTSSIGNNLKSPRERRRRTMFLGLDTDPDLSVSPDSSDPDDDAHDAAHEGKPRGLVGLQNIGNTCYMNSAIQALSNTPPLTQYFLDCAASVDLLSDTKKPGLSRSYQKLVKEIWNKRTRGFVVPKGILYGIRNVNPIFRGYQQHDTQEFLRCFMDQLHEELKEPVRGNRQSPNVQSDLGYITRQPGSSNQISGHFTAMDSINQHGDGMRRVSENCEESRHLYRSQRSPARSSDNIPSATSKGYYRMHSASESSGNGSDSLMDRRRSASFSDARGYAPLPRDFNQAGEHINGNNNTSSATDPNRNSQNEEKEIEEDDEEEAYESCYSGVSDASSLSEEETPPSEGFKREKDSKCPESRVKGLPERDINGSGDRAPSEPPTFRSVISDVFDGRLLSSVQCLTCDRISTRVETFQDLSLPIPSRDHMAVLYGGGGNSSGQQSQANTNSGRIAACSAAVTQEGWVWWLLGWLRSWMYGPAVTLHNCLAAFFSADELKGDNMYSCEKCNKLRNGVKFSKVLGLPEVLCAHLKRFRHELMFSTKIGAKVTFPLSGLDMRPYLHKDCTSTVSTYDLIAVICHAGTAGGGHYTCVARNRPAAQWFQFDDQYVSAVTPQQVAACEAYVLFYKKTNPRMTALRQKALELLESFNELNDIKFYISKQWFNRFNTFAEPGPIDNCDFLCSHGGVSPDRLPLIEKLTMVVSQALWEFFYDNFGGGPACNHLHACTLCRAAAEQLKKRQQGELHNFTIMHQRFGEQESVSPMYAISMNWFRCWQAFAHNKTQQPPPPIDNTTIIISMPAPKDGGASNKASSSSMQPQIKPSADLAQFNEELWRFFHGIYGGGPEVKLKCAPNYSQPSTSQRHASSSSSQFSDMGYNSYDASSQATSDLGLYRNSQSRISDRIVKDSRKYNDDHAVYADTVRQKEINDNFDDEDVNIKSLSHIELYDSVESNRDSCVMNNVKTTQSLQDVSVHNHSRHSNKQTNNVKSVDTQVNSSKDAEKQSILVETGDGSIEYTTNRVQNTVNGTGGNFGVTPSNTSNNAKACSSSAIDSISNNKAKHKPGKVISSGKKHNYYTKLSNDNVRSDDTVTYSLGNCTVNDGHHDDDKEENTEPKNLINNIDGSNDYDKINTQFIDDNSTSSSGKIRKSSYNMIPDTHAMYINSHAVSAVNDLPIENISLKSKIDSSQPGVHCNNSTNSVSSINQSSNVNGNKINSNTGKKKGAGRKNKRQQNATSNVIKKVQQTSQISSQQNTATQSVSNNGDKFAK